MYLSFPFPSPVLQVKIYKWLLSFLPLIIIMWTDWTGILLEDLLQLHPLIWSLQLLIQRKKYGQDFLQKDPSTLHHISLVNLDGRIIAQSSSGEALKYNILFLLFVFFCTWAANTSLLLKCWVIEWEKEKNEQKQQV